MELIKRYILRSNERLIKYGQVNENILLELKMTTSLYNYIEVNTDYYDDEERPYCHCWTDIEGMGYGWAWLNVEEYDWHQMMSKLIAMEVKTLLVEMEKTLYFVYETDRVKKYHFIYIDGMYRKDIIISFSNSEFLV